MNLENNSFFTPFRPEVRQRLVSMVKQTRRPAEHELFKEGDSTDGVYLVIGGKVDLTKKSRSARVVTLASVEAGEFFGEVSVLDNCGRSTGARTAVPSLIGHLSDEILRDILTSEPGETALFFARRISQHLRLTNERYTEEVLRKEKLQLVGEMANSIIHDIRSPLASIKLAGDLIVRQSSGEKILHWCNLINQQADRMISMAQELLDYSRGQASFQKTSISLAELLATCENLNADFLRHQNIDYSFKSIDAAIEGDQQRLLRILQNIINNATEAMGEKGGRLAIQAKAGDSKTVEIHIADNGPGIPEEIRDNFFQPFVTRGKRSGTGLGMAIAKAGVEAHGGSISFVSDKGRGTTFVIRLPLKQA